MYAWMKTIAYMLHITCILVNLGISIALYSIKENKAFYLNLLVFLWNLGIGIVPLFSKLRKSELFLILGMFQVWLVGLPYLLGFIFLYYWYDKSPDITSGETERMTYIVNVAGLLLHAGILYLAAKVMKSEERKHHHSAVRTAKRTVAYRACSSEDNKSCISKEFNHQACLER
ncbi:hypothetical protein CAEBREN_20852 [Caenorhabditis brenneri]|uniref:Uncharacterized protein n=1 Tax=Caenorhabditis brenneri TaxID=135651 RepID=G0MG73_CAEBE|nr:hypothetical protein CAEBREN_20852 [Caenorhabditis brenneri]